jgi:hypothetical protein
VPLSRPADVNVVLDADPAYVMPALAAAPATLTATTPSSSQVKLTWSAVPCAVSYNVYQGTSSSGESSVPVAIGVAGLSTTITGLTSGTTYYYIVRAINGAGFGAPSPEAVATPGGVPPPVLPGAPGSLVAQAGDGQIVLSWAAASGAQTYEVFRGTSAGGESPTPIATGLTGTTLTSAGLDNGTTYYYFVAARNAAGLGPASNEASATPVATPPPPPPTDTLIYDGTSTGWWFILGNTTACDQCASGVTAPVVSGSDGIGATRLKFKTVNSATGIYWRAPWSKGTRTFTSLKLSILPTASNLTMKVELGSRDNQYQQTGTISKVVLSGLTPGVWNPVVIPMTSYPDIPFNFIAIKSADALGSQTFYVDTVSLTQ